MSEENKVNQEEKEEVVELDEEIKTEQEYKYIFFCFRK